MEQLDIFDENMKPLGVMERNKVHETGAWHQAFHCWILSGNSLLFQKRGRNKKIFPNRLDISAAGHFSAGEKPEDAAREIEEEIGLKVKFADLIHVGIMKYSKKFPDHFEQEFRHIFFLKKDLPPEEYKLDLEEVEGLFEINIADGIALFENKAKNIKAKGIEWNSKANKWVPTERNMGKNDFCPSSDGYFLKIVQLAQRIRNGESVSI